jgi:arylsulfatase A-like enzyme
MTTTNPLLLLAVVTLLSLCNSATANAAQKPNVLFISVDDLNDWVGCLGGHPQAKTPNIDALARRGVLMTRAYCAAPACNASRVALLSGLSPHVSGVYENYQEWRKIQPKAVTLPQYFTTHGYFAAGAGKIFHNPHPDPQSWQAYFPSKTKHFPPYKKPPQEQRGKLPWWKGRYDSFDWGPLDVKIEETGDCQSVDWIIGQMREKRDRPFFLACGIYRPHVPWFVPREFFEMFPLEKIQLPAEKQDDLDDVPTAARNGRGRGPNRYYDEIKKHGQAKHAVQGYLASIAYADALVGRLITALDKSDKANNTIVVLWSDHGWHLGEKQRWRKFTLWEESTRVPLIFVVPQGLSQKLPRGTAPANCARTVGLIDIYPTLIDLCGLKTRDDLSGRSLLPLLKNPEADWPHPALTTFWRGNHSVRDERWRYTRYEDGVEELYDHTADPNEWKNLASELAFVSVKKRLAESFPKNEAPYIRAREWLEKQNK